MSLDIYISTVIWNRITNVAMNKPWRESRKWKKMAQMEEEISEEECVLTNKIS